MIPPALLPALLLAASLGAAWWFLKPRARPDSRARRYRNWMVRAGAAFLLPTLAGLALLGRADALAKVPVEFDPIRTLLPQMEAGQVTMGALAGVAIGAAVAAFRARRGGGPIGRPGALTPRSRAELPWGAAVALVAGVTEEPFFRLLLPLLITQVTGSAALGYVLATLLFGALHRYQGWRGMVATTLFGAVMAAMYLMSGVLWVVVLLHALIDLNGLVLWPALSREWPGRRKT